MLSREKMAGLIKQIKEKDAPLSAQAHQKQLESKDQAVITQMTWGGKESSMINAADMPLVNAMIKRLKSKYSRLFKKKGEKQIIGEIIKYVERLKESAKKEQPVDEDKIWQYDVVLRSLTQKHRADGGLNYFGRKNKDVEIHGIKLRELLSYLWLAANDEEAVLRPVHERELSKIQDADERKKAKQALIEEAKLNSFVFNLFDIQREHNSDYPQREADKENDYPSCPQGALGRLVFKVSPITAITAIGADDSATVADVESAAMAEANRDGEEINYEALTQHIESFSIQKLHDASSEIKASAYRYFTIFLSGGLDEEASPQEKEELEKDKINFDTFLTTISHDIEEDLMAFLKDKMRDLTLEGKPEVFSLVFGLYQQVIADLRPGSVDQKNYGEVFLNTKDNLLIEKIRKEGAAVLQEETLKAKIKVDEEIIAYRRKMKELSFMYQSVNELIQNEISRGLLALHALSLPAQNKEWNAIIHKIESKLKFFNETIEKEWMPQLQSLEAQLEARVKQQEGKAAQEVGFSSVLTGSLLAKMIGELKKSASESKRLAETIKKESAIFSEIVQGQRTINKAISFERVFGSKKTDQRIKKNVEEFSQLLNGEIQIGMDWSKSEAWVSHLMRVIQSHTLAGKDREIERIKGLMATCCDPEKQNAILKLVVLETASTGDEKAIETIERTLPESKKLMNDHHEFFVTQFVGVLFSKEMTVEDKKKFLIKKKDEFNDEKIKAIAVKYQQVLELDNNKAISSITWQQRKKAILLIQELFPNHIEEFGIKFLAMEDFISLTQRGEALLGEDKKDAFEAANQSLLLATLDENQTAVATDKDTFQVNFTAWKSVGEKLLGISSQHDPDFYLDINNQERELAIQKMVQFVLLTVCRNLQLTDIRLQDKAELEKITRLYLSTRQQEKTLGGPMYDLSETDTLSQRLNYLGIHLAFMLTTLKPLSTFYNTGHIRILGREQVIKSKGFSSNDFCFVRTSISQPKEIVITQSKAQKITHSLIEELPDERKVTVNLSEILPDQSENNELRLIRPDHQQLKSAFIAIPAQFTLVPHRHVSVIKQQMQVEYHSVADGQERFYRRDLERDFYAKPDKEEFKVKVKTVNPPPTIDNEVLVSQQQVVQLIKDILNVFKNNEDDQSKGVRKMLTLIENSNSADDGSLFIEFKKIADDRLGKFHMTNEKPSGFFARLFKKERSEVKKDFYELISTLEISNPEGSIEKLTTFLNEINKKYTESQPQLRQRNE